MEVSGIRFITFTKISLYLYSPLILLFVMRSLLLDEFIIFEYVSSLATLTVPAAFFIASVFFVKTFDSEVNLRERLISYVIFIIGIASVVYIFFSGIWGAPIFLLFGHY